MRILFALQSAELGSTTTQLLARLRWLSAVPNLEVELVALEDRGALELFAGLASTASADPWRFRERVQSGRHDAVVVIDSAPYLDAIAEISGERCLVVEIQTAQPEALRYLQDRKFACDALLVPSRYSKRVLLERRLLSAFDPVEIGRNAVDPRLFYPTPATSHARPIMGWVGRLDEDEAWRQLLLIASVLMEGGADLEVWTVGGERAPDPVVDAFLESADALELADRLRWFPRIEHGAMRRFYSMVAASGGCLVSTAPAAPFGTTVAEALLCGCPVVAREEGAIGELAPGAGYLPLYREIEEAAGWVARLTGAAAAPLRSKLERDLPDLRQRFAPETVGSAYLAMLVRLIEQRRRGTLPA